MRSRLNGELTQRVTCPWRAGAFLIGLLALGLAGRVAAGQVPGAGHALRFDGVDDYVNVAHHGTLNLGGEFSLELFIEPAGSFDGSSTEHRGLLDKGGYKLYLDERDGRLRFQQNLVPRVATAFGAHLDRGLNVMLSVPVARGAIEAGLYIGGATDFGPSPVRLLAHWSPGGVLRPVGSPTVEQFLGDVEALEVFNDELYVGGSSVSGLSLVRWNGTSWLPVMSGGSVWSLKVFDPPGAAPPALYVGGSFAAGVPGLPMTANLARWTGSAWESVGGASSSVRTMTVWDPPGPAGLSLYAGGDFTTIGGTAANYVARYDGLIWSQLASGVNDRVLCLATGALDEIADSLYVGGEFTLAAFQPARSVARWSGSAWSALGTGLNNTVQTLLVNGGSLLAGGDFTNVGGDPGACRLARWDGAVWHTEYGAASETVRALAVYGGQLVAGGQFRSIGPGACQSAGELVETGIATWDEKLGRWARLVPGVEDRIYAMRSMDEDGEGPLPPRLFLGGDFITLNGAEVRALGRWDGARFTQVGGGAEIVTALAVFQGALYAGGAGFSDQGGSRFDGVARWDGTSLVPVASGFDGAVEHLHAISHGPLAGLYAAGDVRIARWDGAAWTVLATDVDVDALAAMQDWNGALYVGGSFQSVGGVSAANVARWNGVAWEPVAGGVNGPVTSMVVFDNELYVGGRFSAAGGRPAGRIARFDGALWDEVGFGVDGTDSSVETLLPYQNELYVGGRFSTVGTVFSPSLARWNGSAWVRTPVSPNGSPYGPGTEMVTRLALHEEQLVVAGIFERIGPYRSQNLFIWNQPIEEISSSRTSWAAAPTHVAVRRLPGQLRLYVNGQPEAIADASDESVESTFSPLRIGATSGAPVDGGRGGFFAGMLDEVRLFSVVDSEDALRDRINRKLAGTEAGLQAYYRFDEGVGGSSDDLSPNFNAGALVGGPSWITSTAPLGDASAWTLTPGDGVELALSSAFGDDLAIGFTGGTGGFAALIRVDEPPNCDEPGENVFAILDRHYFEYWSPEGGPEYRAVYTYTGHPEVGDEASLVVAVRSAALPTESCSPGETGEAWAMPQAPKRNPQADTLTLENISGGRQFILAREGRTLTMAVAPAASGTTTPAVGVYRYPLGALVDISASPGAGFDFGGWEVSGGSAVATDPQCASVGTVVIDGSDPNKTVTAAFTATATVASTWLGGSSCATPGGNQCWSIPENWCPQIVPDNGPNYEFSVLLEGFANVTLDTSPTIRALVLRSGATLQVNSAIGASVPARAVIVTLPIQNDGGLLAARDGKRLLLDAADIVQSAQGELQASGAGSIVEINGRSVTGGRTSALAGGVIRLLGGGVLNAVHLDGSATVRGAFVPNGQVGILGGEIINATLVSVGEAAGGGDRAATLLPDVLGVAIDGPGSIRMETPTARVGDFFGLLINGPEHTIQGTGVVFGQLVNEGVIAASTAGHELLLLPFPALESDGLLIAQDGGDLRIAGDVAPGPLGGGCIQARGGRIIIDKVVVVSSELDVIPGFAAPNEIRIEGGSDVTADERVTVFGGQVSVVSGSRLTSGGPLILRAEPGGEGDLIVGATAAVSAAFFSADADSDLEVAGELTVRDVFTFDTADEGRYRMLPGSRLRMTGGVGRPEFDPTGYAQLEVGGLDLGLNAAAHIGAPAGFVENFQLETLVIGPGARVALVDQRDNGNRGGPFATPAGSEALYTRTLRFEDANGRLNLNGLHLYYETLIAPGGVGQLQDSSKPAFALGDLNCDGAVNFDDIAAFTQALVSRVSYQGAYPNCDYDLADVNCDGNVDFADIDRFVQCLTAGQCPACP